MYVNKEFDNCVERELSKGLRSRLEDATLKKSSAKLAAAMNVSLHWRNLMRL